MGCLVILVLAPVMVLATPVVLVASFFGAGGYWTKVDRYYGSLGSRVLRSMARFGLTGRS